MTDSEPPGTPEEPAVTGQITAGEVGVHRQSMTVPLLDPGDSLNQAPQRLTGDLLRDHAAAPPHGSGVPTPPERPASPPGGEAGRQAGQKGRRTDRRETARDRTDPSGERPGPVAVAAKIVLLLILRRLMRGGSTPGGARPARHPAPRPAGRPARRWGPRRGRRGERVGSADDGSRTLKVPVLRGGRG